MTPDDAALRTLEFIKLVSYIEKEIDESDGMLKKERIMITVNERQLLLILQKEFNAFDFGYQPRTGIVG